MLQVGHAEWKQGLLCANLSRVMIVEIVNGIFLAV